MKKLFLFSLLIIPMTFEIHLSSIWAANFVVDDLGDTDHGYGAGICSSPCTLRDAIKAANSNVSTTDTIQFSIAAPPPRTILNTSSMPHVTDNDTTIDATGQSIIVQASTITFPPPVVLDSSGNIVKGFRITGYTGDDGFDISAGANGNLVSQMVLNGNAQGLRISGNNNRVEGCFIGTNGTGMAAVANSFAGIILQLGATGNTIGGTTPAQRNIISGNDGNGIRLDGAPGNFIFGNYIGTDATGAAALPNTENGIYANVFVNASSDNIIGETTGVTPGGPCTGGCNLISGNGSSGIEINDSTSTGNQIQSNFIGTDVTGALDLGNTLAGIRINNAPNNIIGGTVAEARNIISGNNQHGIEMNGSSATGNRMQGNFIGTDVSGTSGLGNSIIGIDINGGAGGNLIGGSAAGARNIISGNHSYGVYILDPSTLPNIVQGNFK